MPSPRAVLADIHDFKLDPTKAHTKTRASGRLARHAVSIGVQAHHASQSNNRSLTEDVENTIVSVEESHVTLPTIVEEVPVTDNEESWDLVKSPEQEPAVETTTEAAPKKRGGNKKLTVDKS